MSTTWILYHGGCSDGFGAAWSAWRKLGDGASYVGVNHHEPPPEEVSGGDTAYLLDFAYKRPVLSAWATAGVDVRVIDHHQSAMRDLEGFEGAFFDMTKSGAMLAWEHFHPEVEPPALIKHIQDRDLWLHQLEGTREISAALASHPMRFDVWEELAADVDALAREGAILLRASARVIDDICGHAWIGELAGHKVPIVNATSHWSEIDNRLLELHPDAPFVGVYNDLDAEIRKWSLRSRDTFDVSELARSLGGGGHPRAAGFVERRSPR